MEGVVDNGVSSMYHFLPVHELSCCHCLFCCHVCKIDVLSCPGARGYNDK